MSTKTAFIPGPPVLVAKNARAKKALKNLEELLTAKLGYECFLDDKQEPFDFSGVEVDKIWQYIDEIKKAVK